MDVLSFRNKETKGKEVKLEKKFLSGSGGHTFNPALGRQKQTEL